jgi:hypothetical protein
LNLGPLCLEPSVLPLNSIESKQLGRGEQNLKVLYCSRTYSLTVKDYSFKHSSNLSSLNIDPWKGLWNIVIFVCLFVCFHVFGFPSFFLVQKSEKFMLKKNLICWKNLKNMCVKGQKFFFKGYWLGWMPVFIKSHFYMVSIHIHIVGFLATWLVGCNIIGQYTCIFTNNTHELTTYRLDSNVTQTEKENIFCLSCHLNPDL